VVFCTAYDQFAIKAFRYSALNYLLKPVDPDDLKDTIRRLEEKKALPTREQIDMLVQGIRSVQKQTAGRIALTTNDGMIFVTTADILYCEAESNYTSVVLKNRKVVVSKTLKEIDEALSGNDFYRIHNSYLVNLNQIQKFVRGDGGYVVMNDGKSVSIARARRQEFMELFSRF
jgi:two-component system LytT family response regulator